LLPRCRAHGFVPSMKRSSRHIDEADASAHAKRQCVGDGVAAPGSDDGYSLVRTPERSDDGDITPRCSPVRSSSSILRKSASGSTNGLTPSMSRTESLHRMRDIFPSAAQTVLEHSVDELRHSDDDAGHDAAAPLSTDTTPAAEGVASSAPAAMARAPSMSGDIDMAVSALADIFPHASLEELYRTVEQVRSRARSPFDGLVR